MHINLQSYLKKGGVLGVILLFWYVLTLIYPPVVIPTFTQVLHRLYAIFTQYHLFENILITLYRLLIGFLGGVLVAVVFGSLAIRFRWVKELFYPIVRVSQVVPPISWLILAILWFGLTGKPAMFLVFIAVFSIMTIALIEATEHMDERLLQVADVYQMSRLARLRYVILPMVYPSFFSAFIVSLGLASKMIVMGEVLSSTTGIGGMILDAQLNINTDSVVAWSIVIVLLYYLLETLFVWIQNRKCLRNFWFYNLLIKSSKTDSF